MEPVSSEDNHGCSGQIELTKVSPLRVVAAFCIMAVGAGILVIGTSDQSAGQRDFISYWAAGQQLVHGANPYDEVATLRLERTAGFHGDRPLMMRNPPINFFLALPLGFFSAKVGIMFWMLALLASLVASVRMLWILHGRPANRIHLFSYCFAPMLACLMAGQLGIFLLLGVVLFLYFHKSRPFVAGAALLLCTIKPHLFLPFGIVLLTWAIRRKERRMLAGIFAALLASCVLSFCIDFRAWPQYARMMSAAGVLDEFIPTLSVIFRLLVDRNAMWLQFLPEACGCIWAVWYFWTRRSRWSWMDQGLLLLLVSLASAPYAWFTDEAILLPAVLTACYRADDSGRSLLPFGLFAGVALIEVLARVPLTSPFYLWTVPAWLAWYLYATSSKDTQAEITDAAGGNITQHIPS